MHNPLQLLPFSILLLLPFSSSSIRYTSLNQGSSLSPPDDFLVSSPTGVFTAGFYPVGENAYCFSIWFSDPSANGDLVVVWMANRDQPVNGRNTKLSLLSSGNLVLKDAGQFVVWTSGTENYPTSSGRLDFHDNGNLVLYTNAGFGIWQSFDSPTNTLLPGQYLTRNTSLVSSRSQASHSSGFYRLFFDNDNVLRLIYDGVQITSVFLPPPWLNSWDAGRSSYDDNKNATLDLMGSFVSTDNFTFNTTDWGLGPQRRLVLDHDGNARVYSLDKRKRVWEITWQITSEPCKVHGICGTNGLCTYTPKSGPTCVCLPGYSMKNSMDWSEGCIPDFDIQCNDSDTSYFLQLPHVEFYGYDIGYYQNYTLEECKNLCLSYCNCKGFQYKFEWNNGFYSCFPKFVMFNGYQSVGFEYWIYLRLPKTLKFPNENRALVQESNLGCTNFRVMEINRAYKKKDENGWLKSLIWCTGALGAFEITCLLIFWFKTRRSGKEYLKVSTGFKRFTYAELKASSRNFREEIGRGGGGVVYKGKFSDDRVAAIKCLFEAKQGEGEFLAEVSLIGQLNHANLIEPWGYCAEGRHRVLVYKYMEHGSLAENLNTRNLDWRKRFDIALGTAKGLAYLHEECLEWVLHCDVNPHNILLDSNYPPKVADFGLSKILNRGGKVETNVSKIRGTRGYMAPEWVLHHPITSKVDVYSYGIVVLEMVTGRSPKGYNSDGNNGGTVEIRLVNWVREVMNERDDDDGQISSSWIEKIVDPNMGDEYEGDRLKNLVEVALQCAHENKDARPTMRQVVDMLLYQVP